MTVISCFFNGKMRRVRYFFTYSQVGNIRASIQQHQQAAIAGTKWTIFKVIFYEVNPLF